MKAIESLEYELAEGAQNGPPRIFILESEFMNPSNENPTQTFLELNQIEKETVLLYLELMKLYHEKAKTSFSDESMIRFLEIFEKFKSLMESN